MIKVHFCQGSEESRAPLLVPSHSTSFVEQVTCNAAALLNVCPLSLPLFGLRIVKTKLWLAPSQLINQLSQDAWNVQLRLRFCPHSLRRLLELDETAYKYLFYQVREDYIQERFPLPSDDGMGLVVADIVHHLHATGQSLGSIEIKHFMPSSLNTLFLRLNVKRHVEKSLAEAVSATPAFIRRMYLEKAEQCVAELCCSNESDCLGLLGGEQLILERQQGEERESVRCMVAPLRPHHPGIRLSLAKTGGWKHLCAIDELVVISTRWEDLSVEMARRSGVPLYFKMPNVQSMYSFVSCLSGYYRLLKCWSFDLCKEMPTPSIKELRKDKCHGPVGRVFALSKLQCRGGGEAGVALLSQSSRRLNHYHLYVCGGGQTDPVTLSIRKQNDQFTIEGAGVDQSFSSLSLLVAHLIERGQGHSSFSKDSDNHPASTSPSKATSTSRHGTSATPLSTRATSHGSASEEQPSDHHPHQQKSQCSVLVSRLIPPSDYDQSELLLLCAGKLKQPFKDEDERPKVFRLDMFVSDDPVVVQGSFYRIMHARSVGDASAPVAVKMPSVSSSLELSSRFLGMCDDWIRVHDCDALVQAFGVTLRPLTLVTEWVPYGPLDAYLQHHGHTLKQADLLEAVTRLAKALFFLSQEGIQHNNIRCHSLLVARHEEDQFWVKLAEPGNPEFDDSSIHWIAREHHHHPPTARHDPSTDVWAFATTAWQIFSCGEWPLKGGDIDEIRSLYAAGHVLPLPRGCPSELYQIMLLCWSPDPTTRRQPHSIMRDTFQILYQVFNSRRQHAYSSISEDNEDDSPNVEYSSVQLPTAHNADNPIYEQSGDTVSARNGSVETTTTTLGSGEASVSTLVPLESDLERSAAGGGDPTLRVSTQLTSLRLTDGTRSQVRLGLLPTVCPTTVRVAAAQPLPDACMVPTGLRPLTILPPIPPHRPGDKGTAPPAQACNLSQLLVTPSGQEDGQLVPGQLLKMGQDTIRIDASVGEGNYGYVYRGHLSTKKGGPRDGPVAVKTLKVVMGQLDDMVREIEIMKVLQHSNIVRLLGVISEEGGASLSERLFMVMEYLHMGSLKTYLQQTPSIEDTTLLDFALDVASGMDYLELQRIVHRDLAARNLLVASPQHVKISDFGLAQQLHSSAYYVLRTKRDLPLSWYAPESIEKMRYSHKTDVWSYGVTCWEMFTRGKDPNLPRDSTKLLMALQQGSRLNCAPPCPEVVYSKLIRVCWDHDPRQRPSFSDLTTIVQELKNDMLW